MSADGPAVTQRQDIVVSVCFADISPDPEMRTLLRDVAATLDARYRFWEMLLVVKADTAGDFAPLLAETANIRLLEIRRYTEYYRRRAVAASEAIGDVVLLTALDEVPHLELTAMIDIAADRSVLALARRRTASRRNAALDPLLRALGRSSGFRVSMRNMQTMALPRTLLNQILARPDRQLALRFPPSDAGIPVEVLDARSGGPPRRGLQDLGRRLTLVQRLLVNSAPRLLIYVSFVSAVVAVVGFFYALYSVAAWLILDALAEGWLTLSLMLSMTAMVLGVALLGISLGLQQVLDRLSPEVSDDVVDEHGSMDLFGKVARDLNVEIETSPPAAGASGRPSGPEPEPRP